MIRPAIIVHGGAGKIPEDEHGAYLSGCKLAADTAWKLLESGASALHAVEIAVRILEDDPTFDSGYGSVLNQNGEVEVDAIIMDGATLDLGAVIAVQGIANPVTLARLIMTDTPHKILAGNGARDFAMHKGIPLLSMAEMTTPKVRERYEKRKAEHNVQAAVQTAAKTLPDDLRRGTCGAVALDVNGNVAAATSTGGTPFKMPGRVGDAPLVGSGAYADNRTGAASATGDGEQIMRVVLSKTATDAIGRGMDAQSAADYAIGVMVERVNGMGGIIVVDHKGGVGFAHSDRNIATAWVDANGTIHGAMGKGPG